MTLAELQQRIRDLFGAKDARRGVEGTFMWFLEEVGELAAALRDRTDDANLALEFADVAQAIAYDFAIHFHPPGRQLLTGIEAVGGGQVGEETVEAHCKRSVASR